MQAAVPAWERWGDLKGGQPAIMGWWALNLTAAAAAIYLLKRASASILYQQLAAAA